MTTTWIEARYFLDDKEGFLSVVPDDGALEVVLMPIDHAFLVASSREQDAFVDEIDNWPCPEEELRQRMVLLARESTKGLQQICLLECSNEACTRCVEALTALQIQRREGMETTL